MTDLTRSDIDADLSRRARDIAAALAAAFGGRSQVTPEDIGRAVAGQIANNGLTVHGTVAEVCVAVYDATLFRGDGHYEADDPNYDAVLPCVVGACWERLAESEGYTPYSTLPWPIYSSAAPY